MDDKSKSKPQSDQSVQAERAKSQVVDEKSKPKSQSDQSVLAERAKSKAMDEKSKPKSRPEQSRSEIEVREQQNRRRERAKSQVWDCGSSLYDSFELQSFKRQLDSAIISSSRSLSMPHFSDRRSSPLPPPPLLPPPTDSPKKSSKISRSLQKLLRSVFRSSPKQSSRFQSQDGFFVVYDKTGALTTIPEAPEADHGAVSPEMNLMARRAASARFTVSSIGISCA